MLPKPLLAMIVADTVVLGAFMACVVFQVLSPLRLLFVLVPVMVIVDGVCVVWLLRSRRRGGTAEATEDSEEVRPR
jgi:hypothetical protein